MRKFWLAALVLAVSMTGYASSANADPVNLALAANGGTASASSEFIAGSAAGLNDGVRQTAGWWTDDPTSTETGWAQIAWTAPRTLGGIVVQMPVVPAIHPVEERTFGLLRVQYWSDGTWVDIDDPANPIVGWTIPTTDDGTQIRSFEFAPIETTKIRVYFEADNAYGDSGLEEIEAYAPESICSPNLALATNGGQVSVSSEFPGASASGLNDGIRQQAAWWSADPWAPGPAWAQIGWDDAQTLRKIVVRMPVVSPDHGLDERTFGLLRVQYWDGMQWIDVAADGNPIVDWTIPTSDDGTQIKTFRFAPIETTKLRVVFEDPNALGHSGLEEIEAYGPASVCSINAALAVNGGQVAVSSEYVAGSSSGLNDGIRQLSGWWTDNPRGPRPGWAQIGWTTPKTLQRIVVRMPVVPAIHPVAERTFGSLRVQYWDGMQWVDFDADGNPITNWTIPTTDDGSQVKRLAFSPVQTTKIRVYFETANVYGDSGLEEIEAWT